MKLKRLISWLLASALAASLAVMPIGAAGTSSFGDISDRETAVNADILRLMGVVSGTGGNQFNPNGTLTRAEFCTMVVKFMQGAGLLQRAGGSRLAPELYEPG